MRFLLSHKLFAVLLLFLCQHSNAFKPTNYRIRTTLSRYYALSHTLSLRDNLSSGPLAFQLLSGLQLSSKMSHSSQLINSQRCGHSSFFYQDNTIFRNAPMFASLKMQADTQILDSSVPAPVKKRNRGFGSSTVQVPSEPRHAAAHSQSAAPIDKAGGTSHQEADRYSWDAADAEPDSENEASEEEDSADSFPDALASIRSEPRKPSGARWRSRAAEEPTPVLARRSTVAAPLPSTSRRGNHDYAVAELVRKSTALVSGKPGAAAVAGRISTSTDLYTNPGELTSCQCSLLLFFFPLLF
jgi:hypothetical protein